jgi:hypothetical protein
MDPKFNPSLKEKLDIQQYFQDIKLVYSGAAGIMEPRSWSTASSPAPQLLARRISRQCDKIVAPLRFVCRNASLAFDWCMKKPRRETRRG